MDEGVFEAFGIGYACAGTCFGQHEGEDGNYVATGNEGEGHGGGVGKFQQRITVVRGFENVFHEVVEPFGFKEFGLFFVDFARATVDDGERAAQGGGFAEFDL